MTDSSTAAFLSGEIYNDLDIDDTFGPSGRFVVKDVEDHPSGYYGAIIHDTLTDEGILVGRGTEPTTITDLAADLDIVFGGAGGSQFEAARQFFEDYTSQSGSISVTAATGHSLAGLLAQGIGIAYDLEVISLASPGGQAILNNLEQAGYASQVSSYAYSDKMLNIVAINDPIGNFGQHLVGSTVEYVDLDPVVDQTTDGWIDSAVIDISNNLGWFDEALITFANPGLGIVYTGTKEGLKVKHYHSIDNYGFTLDSLFNPFAVSPVDLTDYQLSFSLGNDYNSVVFGGISALTSLTGHDVDTLMSFGGNGQWFNNFFQFNDGSEYFAFEQSMAFRTSSDTLSYDYNIYNYDQLFFNSTSDHISTPGVNSIFDFDTNSSSVVYTDAYYNQDWLDGVAIDGGNYQASVVSNVLNGNGIHNVVPSSIVTGGYRPGAGTLSGFDTYFDNYVDAVTELGDFVVNDVGSSLEIFFPGIQSSLADAISLSYQFLNIDPLIIDMDGDGVELISFTDSFAVFDVDNDGYAENTGWVSRDDALLVHDANSDGVINDITETLSEYYMAAPGSGVIYEDGFEALSTLDSNSDGVFDVNDSTYSSLMIWQDHNENGLTDSGELTGLAAAGIQSIDLSKTLNTRTEIEGNPIFSSSTATVNGQAREIVSVDFVTNAIGYEWNNITEGLRLVSENGAVSALHIEDTSGVTVDLAGLNSDGDANNDTLNVTGNIGDDVLIGDENDNWLIGGAGSDTLLGGAGNDLLIIDTDDDTANIDAGDGFDIIQTTDIRGININLQALNAEVAIGYTGDDVIIGGGNTNVFIQGGGGDDIIIGGSADDALSGEDGNDTIDGGLGDNLIRGHRGEDLLIGNFGEDLLDGGIDDDRLYSGGGDDILIGGAGNDHLFGGDGYDIAEFRGQKDEYDITYLGANKFQVTDRVFGRDGTDILTDIEALNFKNILNLELAWQNPWTVDDIIEINGSGPYALLASDILANEVDFQNDIVHITEITSSMGGTAILEASGNVTFTPNANYNGVMSFRYKIADSDGNSGGEVTYDGSAPVEVEGTVYLKENHHPDDPLFYEQWYINDINILPIWEDYTGKGIHIGVYEPGILNRDHLDLINNIAQETFDNTVFFENDHATLVSGVIAASKNGTGSIGIAYDSTIHGNGGNDPEYNPVTYDLNGLIDLSNEYKYDITNHSIGNANAFERFTDTNANEHGALFSTSDGRNGLGTISIWGAGNDRAEGRNTNDFDIATFGEVIVVGAINKESSLSALEIPTSPFSTPGANILISAPGSNITSTSRLVENSQGSVFGNDYEVANGTSFATPIITGVVALMLEANPNLGYRDVQEILAYTARIVDDQNTDWQTNGARNWNGGGLHFSHDYGFGNVDALAAVRLAETWHKQETIDNRLINSEPYVSTNVDQVIPDGGTLVDTVEIDALSPLEFVNVTLDFVHEQVGDLVIKLVSPDGTESILLNRQGKALDDPNDRGHGAEDIVYSFGTRAHMGELSAGTWTLEITDTVDGSGVGILRNWQIDFTSESPLHFVGDVPPANTTYVYTDEYLDLTDSSRQILDDGVGSEYEDDTINVAAITGDVNLDLTPGSTSTLNGKSILITSNSLIERAFTGDGNDTIVGNDAINLLWGGRGNDIINGGLGNDWIFGKSGINTLTGGTGGDRFVVQKGDSGKQHIQDFSIAGGDTIILGNYDDGLNFNDLIFVQDGSDTKFETPDGQEVMLVGVLPAQLTEQQFIFNPDFKHLDIKVEEITLTNGVDDTWHNIFTGAVIYALGGNDLIRGTYGDDVIYGGDGDDELLGSYSDDPDWDNVTESGGGADILYGEAGNDRLFGSGMTDTLYGGAGDDLLAGNKGDDIFHLDSGLDSVVGGEGEDRFVIYSLGLEDISRGSQKFMGFINDFNVSEDIIDFRNFSDIESIDNLVFNVAEANFTNPDGSSSPRNVLTIFWNSDDVAYGEDQYISLLDVSDGSELTEQNFVFNTIEPIRLKLDNLTLNEDSILNFSSAALLSNDIDHSGETLLFNKIISGPEHGILVDNSDGTFTYTPEENYSGADNFKYEAINTSGRTATTTAYIDISAVNDAPVMENMSDTLTIGTGESIYFTPSFKDIDGDVLDHTVTLQNGAALPSWLTYNQSTKLLTGTAPTASQDIILELNVSDGVLQTNHLITLSIFNLIEGDQSNNLFINTNDDDTIRGFMGIDTVKFFGNHADYTIVGQGEFLRVTDTIGTDGVDRLYDIERLQFSDGVYVGGAFIEGAPINLAREEIIDFGGLNNVSDQHAIEDDGSTLHLSGNTWKSLDFDYEVTANTILEFDFRTDHQGEIHGIGLDINSAGSANRMFQLYGTQSNWGLSTGRNYDGSGDWDHYRIKVGDFYTGDMSRLGFINDHDVSSPTAESFFRHIKVYEQASSEIDFSDAVFSSYDTQDVHGLHDIADSGATLELNRNTWKKIDFDYDVTDNTIVEFDFRVGSEGEIHGIGFENDNTLSANRLFQLAGTQSNWANSDFSYDDSGDWMHFAIDAGSYFTGQMSYLTFANDHDAGPSDAQSFFQNVNVYEADAGVRALDFTSETVLDFGGLNNVSDAFAVQDGGDTFHLSGNTWKSIDFDYDVGVNTVLEFDFRTDHQGEIHGIGFDTNSAGSASRMFQLYGTQSGWGLSTGDAYSGNGDWQSYQINVGDFYTGAMSRLGFINDHDVGNPTAESAFRDVRVYERGSSSDDVLYGSEHDAFFVGLGGADRFVLDHDDLSSPDTISDFSVAQGDVLDLAALLDGYDPVQDAITDFVQITNDGADSFVAVDANGGADNFTHIATLTNITGLSDETALENNGTLLAA